MSPSSGGHIAGGTRAPHDSAWPELIVSGRPFLGLSSLGKDAAIEYLVRFSRPEHSAAVIASAGRRGAGAIAPMNDTALLQALDLAGAPAAIEVYPVIPNALGYVREATDHGMVGAGLRLVRRLAIRDLLGIGLRGALSARRVLAREFSTILSLLIDVEMAAFRRFRPRLVLLHGQVTDLVLALRNERAFRVFADVIRDRYGAVPGVVTNNFSLLMRSLNEWRIDIPVIVAPFNRRGFLMKPSKAVCEQLLRDTDRYVIADRLGVAATEWLPDDFAYVRELGIRSAMVDVADDAGIDAVLTASRQPTEPPRRQERHEGQVAS